jgi:hypothetical protein
MIFLARYPRLKPWAIAFRPYRDFEVSGIFQSITERLAEISSGIAARIEHLANDDPHCQSGTFLLKM